MPVRHILLALAVALIWGTNFTVVKLCLQDMPPFALCFWRFTLLLPLVLVIKRPPRWAYKLVAGYAFTLGLIKLTLMFIALNLGMPAGLASLVIQTQIIFTTLFSVWFLKSTVSWRQVTGISICITGLVVLALSEAGSGFSMWAFALVLLSAFFWGIANIILKKLTGVAPITIIASIAPLIVLPLLLLNWYFESGHGIFDILNIGSASLSSGMVYISYGSTLLGTLCWAYLIQKYSPEKIVIYAILIPVVSMVEGVMFLGEHVSVFAYGAAALILFGLYFNQTKPVQQQ